MNRQPVYYLQTDKRWGGLDYSARGEKTTIGASGCGPTSAAMLLASLTGQPITPADTAAWSLQHGYKAPGQGTYYTYFVPQFAAYGVTCKRLNTANCYGDANAAVHDTALQLLRDGWWLIACMGKGLWTSSGHFVVVWGEKDGKLCINDPNSKREQRTLGDMGVFRRQVKYYWAIDAREYNREDEDVARYDSIGQMPSWARGTVQKLCDRKLLTGSGKKDEDGYPADLNLSEDMIRVFVVNDRAGLYE